MNRFADFGEANEERRFFIRYKTRINKGKAWSKRLDNIPSYCIKENVFPENLDSEEAIKIAESCVKQYEQVEGCELLFVDILHDFDEYPTWSSLNL